MKILVGQHDLQIDKKDKVNQNEYKVTKCEFEFDEAITNDLVKIALFTNSAGTYKQYIINNECDIPAEILEKQETTTLGVYAYKEENEELELRYSPEEIKFYISNGSYKENAENTEPITPTDKEQMEQALQNGLNDINNKIDEVDEKLDGIDTAIEETNNLNLDVSDKVDGDVTVTLTKKDASTKTVVLSDGTSLEFNWDGTKLGIKTSDEQEYTYVDLQGIQGIPGPQGEPFRIKKTYPSVAEMNADFNNMEYGDYVMIASSVEVEDNAKLYTRGETQWIFITDFSGATGIRGPVGATPSIQIGTVVSGATPSVTRTGTDENPVLNFVLQKGDKGDKGNTGDTGNGISSIEKTSTSGLVDTYTITYTNGNTTTFDVSNGSGIDRIEKTATVGNKDTYTIYFTNGSTTTYEVANGEVTEQEFREEIDRLSMIYNAFPTTTGNGEEITLDGTAEVTFKKLDLKGNTYQESTTGKNKLPFDLATIKSYNTNGTWNDNVYSYIGLNVTVNNDGTFKISSGTTTNTFNFYLYRDEAGKRLSLSAGTYTFSSSSVPSSGNGNLVFKICDNDGQAISGVSTVYLSGSTTSATRTINKDFQVGIRLQISNGATETQKDYAIQIESGSSATSWEKFTGEQPSPNPDYPQDIQVVSGDNTIKVEGKNLFQSIYIPEPSSTPNAVLKAGTYTIASCDGNNFGKNIYFRLLDENNNIITTGGHLTATGVTINFSTSSYSYYGGANTSYITFTIDNDYKVAIGLLASDGTRQVMLVKGSEAVRNYTPYVSQTYPINLGNIELCKIGTYQDKIYKDNGKWYLHKEIGKVVLDGSETGWGINQSSGYYRASRYFSDIYNPNDTNRHIDKIICSHFYLSIDNAIGNLFQYVQQLIFYVPSGITTLEQWKTWLSTYNTTVYYVLATPTYEEITDTTLIEQLDNLENACSYDTQTNITQTNDDMPFILDVEAIMSLKNILN